MSASVCAPGRVPLVLCTVVALLLAAAPAAAQSPTFKVAYFNIQSGKGEPGLPGRPVLFSDTSNCTDTTQPLNAWGVNFVQEHLQRAVGADPTVVALGLSEAWTCGSPTNVRRLLGWRAQSTERNGVALLARHGFAGPEEWVQLDTSLNVSPLDTMWVLRAPVCLDALCTTWINVFSAHWFSSVPSAATYEQWSAVVPVTYDRQAAQTVEFLRRTGGAFSHVLVGDLNAWEGSLRVCNEYPTNAGLSRLRDAGYVDAWPLIHGSAEGFTGMTNRARCGTPEGYVWKRPDYVWSPANFLPVSIARFGVVPAGDPAPSDHYGLIAEFPLWSVIPPPITAPAPPPPPPPVTAAPAAPPPPSIAAPPGEIVLYGADAHVTGAAWLVSGDAQAGGGSRLWNPERGTPKVTAPLAAPSSFAELTFTAEAGRPYRLWIRGKAENNSWANDSLFVQFSGTVNQSSVPVYRIGSAEAATVSIEEGSGVGLSGWGWQDNAYGVGALGSLVYFATSGPQRLRIQQREDGVSLDQVVLSPSAFLTVAPGASRDDATVYTRNGGSAVPKPTPTPTPTPTPAVEEVILRAEEAARAGRWFRTVDWSAAGSARLWNPDAGTPKLLQALPAPVDYFEMTFNAVAGVPYRLWMRGKADGDLWTNDSVYVQFSTTVSSTGSPVWRIGTTDATMVSLEEDSGSGLAGWGWQDNGYGTGVLGRVVVFATSGVQTIRVQAREDGLSIDQIVLSPVRFFSTAPGAPKDDTTIVR